MRIHLIASHPSSDEDLACAEFLRAHILRDAPIDAAQISERIRQSGAAQKFLDPQRPRFNPRDIDFCAKLRPAEFAMLAVAHPSGPRIIKVTQKPQTQPLA